MSFPKISVKWFVATVSRHGCVRACFPPRVRRRHDTRTRGLSQSVGGYLAITDTVGLSPGAERA